MGFIGENGAGKSTTIKNILGLHLKDKGEVEVFGRTFTGREKELKELLGVALDDSFFAPGINGAQIEKALSSMYSRWDREIYYKYLERFSLNPKKCVKDYSKGMKMKLSLAAALSHGAKLLIDLDIPSRAFCEEMFHRTGAFVTPGECFELEHCMRIGYACDADTLKAGLAAVDEYIALKEKEEQV